MAVIDRLMLRMAVCELLRGAGTPPAVVINEALELARTFSTEDAVKFINGMLDGVQEEDRQPTESRVSKRSYVSADQDEQIQQRKAEPRGARAARRRDLSAQVRAPRHGVRARRRRTARSRTTSSRPSGPETITSGRILAIRSFGKANFLAVSDGRSKIQIYIRQDSLPALDFQIFKLLDFGDWIGVEGRLFRTKTNELTIWASRLHFLAKCLLPLPEKWHGLTDVEIRYRQRYLDLIVNPDSRRVFEVRSQRGGGDPRVHDRARLSRSGDADDAADRRRRARAAVRDAPQHARHGSVSCASRPSCT